MKINKHLKTFLKAVVSVVLLYFLFRNIEINDWQLLKKIPFNSLLQITIIYLIANILSAYRWQLAMEGLKIKISYQKSLELTFIGLFFNNFLPSSVGGDIYKIYYFKQQKADIAKVIVSTIVDRLNGVIASIAFVLVFGLYYFGTIKNFFQHNFSATVFLWIIILLIFIIALILNTNFKTKLFWKFQLLQQVFDESRTFFFEQKAISWQIFVISLLMNILGALGIYFGLVGLGDSVESGFLPHLFLIPIINIGALLPISINSIGVSELLAVQTFPLFAYNGKLVLLSYLLWRIIGMLVSLIGGIVFVIRKEEMSE